MASEPRMPIGMSRCGFFASCAAVETGVEADIGEEHHRGPAHQTAHAIFAGRDIGRNEPALRIARGYPVVEADERRGGGDEHDNDHELDRDDHVVRSRRFVDADDEQRGNLRR